MPTNPPFTILYDGHCPLCLREVRFLKRRSDGESLLFEDIQGAEFHPETYGRTKAELMARIHGVRADGELVTGVEVFREAYRRIGLGWILAPTTWRGIRQLADYGYTLFARNRLRIGRLLGRNDGEDCGNSCTPGL